MKATEKLATAKKVLEFAKEQGFKLARLQFIDQEDDTAHDTVEEVAANYAADDTVNVIVHLELFDDLEFELVGDPNDEDADPEIKYN
jgi:hypothetical protein